jgi:hypothetical protein
MHLIEVTHYPCVLCGRGNTPDPSGDRPRFVDLERDVNWNDPVILCEDCVSQIGALVGLAGKETVQEMEAEIAAKDQEIHDLNAEIDTMKRRAKRMGVEFVESAA